MKDQVVTVDGLAGFEPATLGNGCPRLYQAELQSVARFVYLRIAHDRLVSVCVDGRDRTSDLYPDVGQRSTAELHPHKH